MIDKIRALYEKYKDIILYIVFGFFTFIVNYVVFFLLVQGLGMHYVIANIVAWIAAVAFAYVTNRGLVFHSEKKGRAVVGEAAMFAASRLLSLGCELLILIVGDSLLHFDINIVKLVAQVVVIVLNYIFSKIIVFRKKS